MEPNSTINNDEIQPLKDKPSAEQPKQDTNATAAAAGGGWGWGFSPLSVLSDLQKAAEEISRNAAEVAKTAANSISDLQKDFEDSESSKESHPEASDKDQDSEDEDDKKRKAALERLEKASEDTFLGQGIKAIDTSVESFATGAWQALGNAWKGGSSFVQKLEDSIQQGGLPAAGSVLETGRAITAKGIEVLEYVGKETVDLLITESGMEVDKNAGEGGNGTEVDQLMEEVTFDRCFYIYGGPEQLEVYIYIYFINLITFSYFVLLLL
ncbi:hypothetical protein Hdeb2414_s0047g00748851 [Helianthus debilis subsp. tardiflorus]